MHDWHKNFDSRSMFENRSSNACSIRYIVEGCYVSMLSGQETVMDLLAPRMLCSFLSIRLPTLAFLARCPARDRTL